VSERLKLKLKRQDKAKLMEWSRQMEQMKHSEHVEQLEQQVSHCVCERLALTLSPPAVKTQ
jgi:hypothetical protein